jgi:hypothetical protein
MFGFGSRNPQMRYLRFGLLGAVLLAGVVFHKHGSAYTTIRVVYYVALGGFIGFAIYSRTRAKRQGTVHHGDTPGVGPTSTTGSAPGSPIAQSQNPGWYPDQKDMHRQRYWDGTTWTDTRHWDGTTWVDD